MGSSNEPLDWMVRLRVVIEHSERERPGPFGRHLRGKQVLSYHHMVRSDLYTRSEFTSA